MKAGLFSRERVSQTSYNFRRTSIREGELMTSSLSPYGLAPPMVILHPYVEIEERGRSWLRERIFFPTWRFLLVLTSLPWNGKEGLFVCSCFTTTTRPQPQTGAQEPGVGWRDPRSQSQSFSWEDPAPALFSIPGRSKILTLDLHFRISGSSLSRRWGRLSPERKRGHNPEWVCFWPKRQNPKVSSTQTLFFRYIVQRNDRE